MLSDAIPVPFKNVMLLILPSLLNEPSLREQLIGIETDVNPVHSANDEFPIEVKVLGNDSEVRLVQSKNI
jgi:hypothetical protein